MTARSIRPVRNAEGRVFFECRTAVQARRHVGDGGRFQSVVLAEKENFLSGHKTVAIISEAASTGISLHSSPLFANSRPRLHITLELPWSAESAVQQLGRTHRAGQRYPPHYYVITSDIGEPLPEHVRQPPSAKLQRCC